MSYVAATHYPQPSERRGRSFVGSMVHSIAEFFFLIDQAKLVFGDYEKLSHLSDRELKERGLTRTEVSSHVFAKHFG